MPSTEKLQAEIDELRLQVEELEQEKVDLETLLEMTAEHSDSVEEELYDKAEEAIKESERRLRMIIQATPVAVVITDIKTGIIVFTNAIAGPLIGLSTDEIVGRKVTDFYADPSERVRLIELLNKNEQVDHSEVEFVRDDGSRFWIDISMRYLEFNETPCILAAWNDISHLKELQEAALRFVPREFLSFMEKDSLVDIHLGDHISDEMTVMFTDLRSFTSISEDMSPQQNFNFINSYLSQVSPLIKKNEGFIVKYMGDGIMALFPRDADHGVQAGIDTLNQVNIYNAQRAKVGRFPISVGIGVNTGYMMVGVVGDSERMEADSFSSEVTLTSRVEGLTKYYNVSFIITAATKQQLINPSQYKIRFLDKVQVQGKSKALELYEVYDADPAHVQKLKDETKKLYEQAMVHYYAMEFEKTQEILFHVLLKNPKDRVAWHHLTKATQCLESGVEENWSGVTIMTSK